MVFGFGNKEKKALKKEKEKDRNTTAKRATQRPNNGNVSSNINAAGPPPAQRRPPQQHQPQHQPPPPGQHPPQLKSALKAKNSGSALRHSNTTQVHSNMSASAGGTSVRRADNRHPSPLKSAMKSSSKYNSNMTAVAGRSLATPVAPRAKHKYIGPIDVDDIPTAASSTPGGDVDDYDNGMQMQAMRPTSTIKSAVKKTEATIKPALKNSTTSSHSPSSNYGKVPPPNNISSNPNPAVVTPPSTRSSLKHSNHGHGGIPSSITQKPSHSSHKSGSSVTSSHSHRRSHSNSNHTGNLFPFVYNPNSANNSFRGGDDMSVVSMGDKSITDMSVMSRVSVHMDHFLAEMALADNTQLEKLAVEEMKHRQVIPQKIKKLDKKINQLHEERDVLVGLIDQLQELVDNQENAKRKRRERRKEKKRLKKEKKKAKKKKKRESEARKMEQHKENETDSDEEYLQRKLERGAESIKGNWWKEDEKSVATTPGGASVISSGDPILGGRGGGLGADDGDDFSKLWDDSFSAGSEGLDVPTLDAEGLFEAHTATAVVHSTAEATSNTAAKVAAGIGVAAAAGTGAAMALAASNKKKNKKDQKDSHLLQSDTSDSEDLNNMDTQHATNKKPAPTEPKKKTSKRPVQAFSMVEGLPDKEDEELFGMPADTSEPNLNVPPDTDTDDDLEDDIIMAGNIAAAQMMNNSKKGQPNSLRNLRLSKAGKKVREELDDDSAASLGSNHSGARNKRNTQRFSVFHETDTYLPDHLPGSQGNSPEGSVNGKGKGKNKYSDSDSDSDSESDSIQSSGSSDMSPQEEVVLEDEDDDGPSESHALAKQLMARLKQQEKQQEQEELQGKLQGIIRRNSQRRLSMGGESDADMDSSYQNLAAFGRGPPIPPPTSSSLPASIGASAQDNNNNGDKPKDLAAATNSTSNMDSAAVADLRKQLESSVEELETLKKERTFQETRVKELLAALDTKFDEGDEDEELEEASDINDSFDEDDRFSASNNNNSNNPDANKKRKRMQVFLTQKVDECAELAATVEQLKEQVSQKQTKIEVLEAQREQGGPGMESLRTLPTDNTYNESMSSIPKPPGAIAAAVSADLGKDFLQKQLLEKTAECFDLQEQITKLEEQLVEKDEKYQEVHRDLFTANLALGVEVDRKAQAQEALDEKGQELEAVQKENEELKTRMNKMEECIDVLDDELVSRANMLEEMKEKHDDGLNAVATELESTKTDLAEKTKELVQLRDRVANFDREKEGIINEGSANEKMVAEMKNLLIVETDHREQAELKVKSVEEEKEALLEDIDRLKKENEINKALLQDKKETETQDGMSRANVQVEVEKLIAENAELKKTLVGVQESEASMKKERERLVANATNMSIMLADSRAKVDFIQMQLEEYKSGALSSSQHGMKSQSEHGFSNQSAGFRKLMSGSSHGPSTSSAPMNDNSERSMGGGMNNSQRGARFRSFLQNRMGAAGGDS